MFPEPCACGAWDCPYCYPYGHPSDQEEEPQDDYEEAYGYRDDM